MLGIKVEEDLADQTSNYTFSGVNFVLLGFDLVYQQKVRSKLVSRGGVDVGQYAPVCTHVIVHNLVYDDPICIAARADGKVLVTGLWVDHSFDVGMPVDPNSVMYTPLQGKDGIPGSESLIVCLTGYQRQDRDDIMTMVGLMGAKFSKPLVANKVTHLICYKFEGEKYELAKKMNKIKLVNHQWLEECLKAWTILPEADYDKSGYELEMMEAEAKDSEEEDDVQEPGTKESEWMKNVASPHSLTARERVTPKSKENSSKSLPTSSVPKGLLQTTTSDATVSASREGSLSVKNLNTQDTDKKNTNVVGFLDHVNLQDFTCDEPFLKNPTSTKGETNLSAHSDASKLSSASNLRKTMGKKTLLAFEGENRSNSCSKVDVDEVNNSDGLEVHLPREEQPKLGIETGLVRSPPREHRSSLSGKRKLDVSYGKSKSPKMNCDSKSCNSGSPSVSQVIKGSVSANSINDGVDKNASPTSIYTSPVNVANTSPISRYNSLVNLVKENASGVEQKTLSKNMHLSIEHGIDDIVADAQFVSIESVKSQRKQEDHIDPSPKAKSLGLDKSSSPKLDTLIGKDGDFLGKPVRKKVIAKRNWSLGSRPKVGLGKVKNKKGSICLSYDASASMIQDNEIGKAETLPRNCTLDKEIVENPENKHVNKMGYTDDETEPPEDKQEDQYHPISGERDGEESKVKLVMKDISECTVPSTTRSYDKAEGTLCAHEFGAKSEYEVSGEKDELDEPTTSKGCDVKKSTKTVGKRKSVQLVSEKRKNKEGVSREDSENKKKNQKMGLNKEKSCQSQLAKAESAAPLEITDISTEVGKEKKSIGKTKSVSLVSVKGKSKEGVSRKEPENKNKHQNMGLNREKINPSPIATESTASLENADTSIEMGNENSPNDKKKSVPFVPGKRKSRGKVSKEEPKNKKNNLKTEPIKGKNNTTAKIKGTPHSNKAESSIEVEKENIPLGIGNPNVGQRIAKAASNFKKMSAMVRLKEGVTDQGSVLGAFDMEKEPTWFLLTGHMLQRKEFQQVIKRLRGRVCRDTHKWSYQATHLIYPDPLRRTEKFFAAAASGRWILKTDYLAACNQEGKFLAEEPYEWQKKGLSEDGAINLEAPKKWRLLRERTGHGALYGMRVIIYGECIAPSLDTLKRVIKAGDGTILATSPPYTRFLNSDVDYAIVSPGMPRVDIWVQEFLRHEIPCVVADYLVEYVCKPGYPLERHVQYNTEAWAERSFASLQHRSQEVVLDKETLEDDVTEDVTCQVCKSREKGEKMLICGDESGSLGCGVGTHIDCCNPPLESVPDEDWFCSKCSKSKKSKASSKSTKKGRSSKGK